MPAKILETKKILNELQLPKVENPGIVGIGGTVTSLSAFKQRLFKYDASVIHKSRLTVSEIDVMLEEFANMTPEEISYLIPFDRQRADILTTGTMIVREVLNKLNVYDFQVSDRGLQFGILYQDSKTLAKML
jgi:exopolyphosphatase/guanosine-5'-triphosphate,3'-diphosphate pyrophosphatase